jgi:hypothetical protein
MGACMSSNVEDLEQKKRSQQIDRRLEEDSRRLRRECKILLLGMSLIAVDTSDSFRLRREWQVYNCQTNEDYTSEWLQCRRTDHVSVDHLQECH